MTEKEIEERLQALPYDVPSDIRPSAVSILMTAARAEGSEAEEKFWEHLRHLSPSEQGEFFASARATREASKSVGTSIIIAILIIAALWLLF